MKIYSISYDLKAPGKNYENLYQEIKKKSWANPLDSNWLIKTDETADQIYSRLSKHLDKNDLILINQFGQDYQGVLLKEIWEWVKN